MILRRTIAALAVLLLLASSVRAQEGEDEVLREARARWEKLSDAEKREIREAYENWKRLSEDERRRRRQVFEDILRGSTPGERDDDLRKLADVKRRTNLEELKRKQQRIDGIVRRFRESLPATVEKKLSELPEAKREAVLTYAVVRMSEVLRDRFLEALPAAAREGIRGLHGRERGERLMKTHLERALERLTEEERAELRALPEAERRRRMWMLLRKLHEEDLAAAREAVAGEIANLVDLPADEMEERLRTPRILGVLRDLGVADDHDLVRRLVQLPWPALQRALHRLREVLSIEDRLERREALEEFRKSFDDRDADRDGDD